jgi:hypothetical protein
VESSGSALRKPRLFVGSSQDGRRIAELLKGGLEVLTEVTVGCKAPLETPSGVIDGVLDAARAFDFAVFVMTSDEMAPKRSSARSTEREALLLQLGVFLGALGRQRTFIVCPTSATVDLSSDLRGVTLATYRPTSHGDLPAALGCASAIIKEQILRVAAQPGAGRAGPQPPDAPAPPVARRRRRGSLGVARSVGPKREWNIADISASGALLETYGELPENKLLDLDLMLEDGSSARVTAKVVRVQHPQWGRIGGVGVAFIRFDGDSRAAIERYVQSDPALAAASEALLPIEAGVSTHLS